MTLDVIRFLKHAVLLTGVLVVTSLGIVTVSESDAFCESNTSSIYSITPNLGGSLVRVNPSSLGGEFEFAYIAALNPNRSFWIGPRFGLMWASGSSGSRFDLQTGLEGTLWFMNAIGAGLNLDLVIPNDDAVPVHIRLNPNLALRVLRFQESGAWSIRFGIIYDFFYQWGGQLGISLQWKGVPRARSNLGT